MSVTNTNLGSALPGKPAAVKSGLARSLLMAVAPWLVVLAVIAAWQVLPSEGARFWLSSPLQIGHRLADWIRDPSVWGHVGSSLATMVVGYGIGAAGGIGFGLLLGLMPRTAFVLSPYITGLQALPKIALIPFYIVLFGIGFAAKVAIVSSAIFFQVFSNTLDGVRNIDKDVEEAIRLMGANDGEIARKVLIMGAMPWIANGLRISVRDAIIYTIVAELFASNEGIGYLILHYSNTLDFTGALSAICILVFISLLASMAVTSAHSYKADPKRVVDGR